MNWKENGLHKFLHLKPVKFLCWLNSAFYRDILENAGKISAEIAKEKAESEFEMYRVIQDRTFKSDFDLFSEEIEKLEKK